MKIHRFFLNNPLGEEIVIKEKQLLHQWNNVLKFKIDENLILFDGKEKFDYVYTIKNINKWEVKLNGNTDSYWEYKHDAIDQIIEILDTNGDENGLDGFKDEDDYEMSKGEIADMLDDMDESDFYDKLEELKEFVGYEDDIRLINIADEDEIEFLE